MKNWINWFIIPTSIFERAHNFYNTIFNRQFELTNDMLWYDIAIIWNKDNNSVLWYLSSNINYKVSQDWVVVYFDTFWEIDNILNRVIPAWWKIKKPKTNMWIFWFIAHIQDTEWNIIWLYQKNND